MENIPEQPKAGIIIDTNPETGEISAGVDLNDDGKAELSFKVVIKDIRFWYVVGAVALAIVVLKAAGTW